MLQGAGEWAEVRPKGGKKFCKERREARRANRPQDGFDGGWAAVGSGAAGAPGGPVPGFCGDPKKRPRGLPGLSQGGAQILGAYAGSNSVCRFCGSLGLFQKEARIFNAWVSRNFVYPFCGLL